MSAATPRGLPFALTDRVVALAGLGLVTILGGVLRLGSSFSSIRGDPYYDAAARSMSLSWHNFLYGAIDPGGSVSIDKTPVDLWLQVASVKLLGFSSFSLRLPEAVTSTAAIPLLYALVARLFGRGAGIAAAAALAVLPVSVITGRSDTMDSVMMALLVLAGLLVVRAAQGRRTAPLLAAGAVLGLAFNVKLFQALVPLPAFGALYVLAAHGPIRQRLLQLAKAAAVFVTVALAWVSVAGLTPLAARPYPVGSTNGGVWNALFVFNGIDRLRVPPTRAAAALDPAGPGRLFSAHGLSYGSLVGTELLAALLLGGLAILGGALYTRGHAGAAGMQRRSTVAGAAAIGVWLGAGTVLFSTMGRLHPRYLEAFTPGVAAAVGVGLAALATMGGRRRPAAAALAVGTTVSVVVGLSFAPAASITRAIALAAVAATVAGCTLLATSRRPRVRAGFVPAVAAFALIAVLAVPFATSAHLAAAGSSSAGRAGAMPDRQVASLSRFLKSHQHGARYEVASSRVTQVTPLIVRDAKPVLMLTSLYGRPLTSVPELAAAVRSGNARYALLGRSSCGPRAVHVSNCAPAVRWARRHGIDVSEKAGLRRGLLFQLNAALGPTR